MKNYENLNERVENAVKKFHQSEELRRSENKSLSRILNDLEIKFEARTAELKDCELRIGELEESNVSLSALVSQLVDLVEKSADDITQDPLYRASAAASEIVHRYVGEKPANEDTGPAESTAAEPGTPSKSPGEALSEGRFEDIAEEFLLAEELFEKTEGAGEFPKLVYDAMALARGEEPAPAVETPVETPAETRAETPAPEATAETGAADAAPASEGDLDIKEIMARLEIAAERAQLRADEDARRDRGELEPEVPGRAVGGRA